MKCGRCGREIRRMGWASDMQKDAGALWASDGYVVCDATFSGEWTKDTLSARAHKPAFLFWAQLALDGASEQQ